MRAREPRPRNPGARALRTFKPKVVKLKTQYTRKGQRRPEAGGRRFHLDRK